MKQTLLLNNLCSQVDDEEKKYILIDGILNHVADDTSVRKEEGHSEDVEGRKRRRLTTKRWTIVDSWKDGTEPRILLKDTKESYPVEVVEYAKSNEIDDDPAFIWWVPNTLKNEIVLQWQ